MNIENLKDLELCGEGLFWFACFPDEDRKQRWSAGQGRGLDRIKRGCRQGTKMSFGSSPGVFPACGIFMPQRGSLPRRGRPEIPQSQGFLR